MAKQKTITYDPFKRGDTPVFVFNFSQPDPTFVWDDINADFAMTAVDEPNDNSGAGVVRLAESLTVNEDNSCTLTVQPTTAESKALSPDTTYKIEVQLKDNEDANVATAITGQVLVEQDYVI